MELIESSEWSKWNHCPTEILCLIFNKAEPTTLLTCMQVNKRWRQIAKYVARSYGKWKKIVEQTIEDEGVTYKQKSTLDWSDIYINSVLWRLINEADVIMTRVYKGTKMEKGSVYNDNLIVIDNHTAMYYGIAEGDVRRTIPSCHNIQENDYMLVKYVTNAFQRRLYIYGKLSSDNHNHDHVHTVENSFMYMLDDDRCYILSQVYFSTTIVVCVVIWNRMEYYFRSVILGSYTGEENGIVSMHICHDVGVNLYIIYKCGKILQCQTIDGNGPINTIFRLHVPFYAVYGPVFTFHKYNVILPARKGLEFSVSYHVKWDAMVMVYPKLTCITDHGNVLFLGCSDGKVDIYLKRKLKMKNYKPEMCIDLTSFEEYDSNNTGMLWMDVHESNHSHHLFIGTLSRVYQIIISHSPLNEFFQDIE